MSLLTVSLTIFCEIFAYFCIEFRVGQLSKSFLSPPLSAGLMTMLSRVLRFWWAVHSSLERFENSRLLLQLSFWMSTEHFLTRRSTEVNWPSGGVQLDFFGLSDSNSSL